jgi:hypothetical protein
MTVREISGHILTIQSHGRAWGNALRLTIRDGGSEADENACEAHHSFSAGAFLGMLKFIFHQIFLS